MTRRALPALAAIGLAFALTACATKPVATQPLLIASGTQSAPMLIPYPVSVRALPGQFRLTSPLRVVVAAGDTEARSNAELLVGWATRAGVTLTIDEGGNAAGAIAFVRDPQVAGDEAYALDVTGTGIRAAASTSHGLFNAAVTVYQLLSSAPHVASIPAMHIDDAPRFAWRGLMLDSARHFQTPDQVRALIDQMALHKLDVMHWHLTDDQGWRLQIRRYPELTRIGGCRAAIGPDVALTGSPKKPYCAFYTQDDVRAIVKYAADRYITIVPEIEMPGHAQAPIAAYPWLGTTGRRPKVSTDWGVNTWLYAPTDRTFTFLQNVLDEVMELFPSTYIHVGGDEAVKDQWQASNAVQAQMRKLGIDSEEKLQGWFIARIGTYLDQHGRRLIGWDEILDGDVPTSAAVMSWRGTAGAVTAANKGHDVVLAASPVLYLDHLQSDRHDEPAGRQPVISLKDVYAFETLPADIAADNAKHVLGAQVTVFSEYTPTWARVQHVVFPRIAALAERTWSPSADWPGFLARMPAQLDRYRSFGIDAADSGYAVTIDATRDSDKTTTVTLSSQLGYGQIRYTRDGSAPTAASALYSDPFTIDLPATVAAASFAGDEALSAARSQRIDAAFLRRRNSDQLVGCTDKYSSRLEAPLPLEGTRAVHKVDLMNTCWLWKGADLTGISRIAIDVDRLPYNFQLWHDAAGIVARPKRSAAGEVEVRLDGCKSKVVATLPLARARNGQATLEAPLPEHDGPVDLCLIVTGKPGPFIWVLGDVQLR